MATKYDTQPLSENIFLDDADRKWYVLYTKPKHEFKAAFNLHVLEIMCYLPTIDKIKVWSDRKKKITEPAFRGYIFIKATPKERTEALTADGVSWSVMHAGRPATIPQKQLMDLHRLLSRGKGVHVSEEIIVGSRVKVISGAFEGVEAVVYDTKSSGKMIAINVEMLNRSVSVQLPSTDVVKIIEPMILDE
ncbi:MAG: UpxY family transcription antiterminator [Ignavibacteriales bacterium]|nr:UpxY family transcription antiterminator [Ignavibacteriales bacterium]MCF8305581.1 UpxY family transcription antiterminator [Ignavibacteriales bacterium]MCF8315303.1 UpxY family transcription antiterminator [Ignavibacteriales bacterium]MCF8436805.1 UpxY family transcription antiterminator [Ignavibacteriales bacterium]